MTLPNNLNNNSRQDNTSPNPRRQVISIDLKKPNLVMNEGMQLKPPELVSIKKNPAFMITPNLSVKLNPNVGAPP